VQGWQGEAIFLDEIFIKRSYLFRVAGLLRAKKTYGLVDQF
jgi:hypothetical protein